MIREKIANWIGKSLRALGINTPGLMDYFLFGGGQATASGVRVNENNALTISTVHQCVRVIADTVASLPCFVYRRLPGNGGKERAVDHPLYAVLHEEPNPYMTPFEFKQTLTGHLLLWGNAYRRDPARRRRQGRGAYGLCGPIKCACSSTTAGFFTTTRHRTAPSARSPMSFTCAAYRPTA